MSPRRSATPIGTTVRDDIAADLRDPAYRKAPDRLTPFEQLARVIILRRAELGITQEQLAARVGTTASSISRVESGQHRTTPDMLRKLADALGGQAVIGFEFGTADEPRTELVTL